MRILGISSLDTDATAALYDDGALTAIAEERLSRVKMHVGFPGRAIERLLKDAGISGSDIDLVVYPFMPWHVEGRRILGGFLSDLQFTLTNGCSWPEKYRHLKAYHQWQSTAIRSHRKFQHELNEKLADLGITCPLKRVEHHPAHAWSAYLGSGFPEALAITIDWYGGGLSGAVSHCSDDGLRVLQAFQYPHSLGLFYAQVTSALGFKPARHEGKILGLAAYGDPEKVYPALRKRLSAANGDFRYHCGMDPQLAKDLAKEHSREDVAAAYQHALEETAVQIATYWMKKTGLRHIVLAGGVAANVKMNQRIGEIETVDGVFIHPNMGDGGTAVGAIFSEVSRKDHHFREAWRTCYLGPKFSDDQIKQAITNAGLSPVFPEDNAAAIAKLLAAGKIIARFDGAMEYGPRALGNRSILYRASDPDVNNWLNKKLGRTEFMPFAPITMAEHCGARYKNIAKFLLPARFMTITVHCTDLMQEESPAAVHIDGTARPQILRQEDNPNLHEILAAYHKLTGIPTLINTSFNMHEEPIVCTPEDAVRAFLSAKLDYLSIGPYLVEMPAENQSAAISDEPTKIDIAK